MFQVVDDFLSASFFFLPRGVALASTASAALGAPAGCAAFFFLLLRVFALPDLGGVASASKLRLAEPPPCVAASALCEVAPDADAEALGALGVVESSSGGWRVAKALTSSASVWLGVAWRRQAGARQTGQLFEPVWLHARHGARVRVAKGSGRAGATHKHCLRHPPQKLWLQGSECGSRKRSMHTGHFKLDAMRSMALVAQREEGEHGDSRPLLS